MPKPFHQSALLIFISIFILGGLFLSFSTTQAQTPDCSFTRDLSLGSRGQDVNCLQRFLQAEGFLSGNTTTYFGPITENAVSDWQEAEGISPAQGYFGSVSQAQYNQTTGDTTTTQTTQTTQPTTQDSDRSALQQQVRELMQQVISLLQELLTRRLEEAGIDRSQFSDALGDQATDTPSSTQSSDTSDDSDNSDDQEESDDEDDDSGGGGGGGSSDNDSDDDPEDDNQNEDTEAPTISSISESTDTDSATISWDTNEAADSEINYGTTNSYGDSVSDNSDVTDHSLDITGLSDDTTYHYQISSTDDDGNTQTTGDRTFTTDQVQEESDGDDDTDSLQGDHDALMALYNSTGGDNWDNNNGWGGDPSTMGSWYGVETNDSGRVVSVKLNGTVGWDIPYLKGINGTKGGNNLVGTLPSELSNLKQVRYFNVKQNELTGELPADIGQMQDLEVLLLNGRTWDPEPGVRKHHNGKTSTDGGAGIDEKTNLYSGPIPTEFGNLSNLKVLELIGQREDTDTGVEGSLPSELGQLSNLEALHLAFNELTGELPDEIFGMESLIAIDINRNDFTGQIPVSINETWTNMVYMSLGDNQFSGEMPELSNLRNLKYFGVSSNKLTGNIEWMEDVDWTQELSFTFDFNDDYYDDSLGFTGNIPDLTTLSGATTLHLQGNKFTGNIPDSVTDMWRVIILTFAWNDLSGELPQTGWGDFSNNVRHFTMNSNSLTGNIPGGLIESADNEDLQNLRFSNNNFTSMDVEAANNLQNGEIQINNNKLTFKDFVTSNGSIPSRVTGYDNQQPFGSSASHSLSEGENITIDDFNDVVTHADNVYQWKQDGDNVSGGDARELTINNASSSDAGTYTLEVTNPGVPNLTLESEEIDISVGGVQGVQTTSSSLQAQLNKIKQQALQLLDTLMSR